MAAHLGVIHLRLEEANAYTERCFNGEPASCSFACPFHLDTRNFLEKMAKGRWNAAYKVFRNAVVFPAVVSRCCPHPCRERCQRVLTGNEPIDMGALENALLKYAKPSKPDSYTIPPKDKSIAIVGAGPAGLSCALNLSLKKFNVTVYERGGSWGGSLKSMDGFAEMAEDIALQMSSVKCEFKFDTEIKSLDELSEFDVVYIATGKGGDSFGLLESWNCELLTTSNPKVFMGGELCGRSIVEGIAEGISLSQIIEIWLQTGKAVIPPGGYSKTYCGHMLDHSQDSGSALVPVTDEASAMAEAGRCMQCNCENCMVGCEMLAHFRKKPHRLSVEVYTDSKANPPISAHSLTRETYSCNDCGYCKSVCPEGVDIGALLHVSREMRAKDKVCPRALHDYWLREMEFHTHEAAFSYIPENAKYIFFPGCRLTSSMPWHVRNTFELLLKKNSCGIMLNCCGAPAFWAGEREMFEKHLNDIKTVWENAGKPTFVFACATCESLFEKYLNEIDRKSLYSLIEAADVPKNELSKAAVFDPCASRDDAETRSAVRHITEASGINITEHPDNGHCCGYGGQIQIANPKLFSKIAENRVNASTLPYITYCANCREVFAAQGKNVLHVLDLVFGRGSEKIPTLEQKRMNTLNLKNDLSRKLTGHDFSAESHPWDNTKLIISPELQDTLDKRLICAGDIRETIWNAEHDNTGFLNGDHTLACMITDVLTYWVDYRLTDNGYEVFDSYTHRMKFRQETV